MNILRKFLSASLVTSLVLSSFMFLFASATVTYAQDDECPTAQDSYVIGFANLTEDIIFTQLVGESIASAAEEAGNIELITADNRLDGATALANAENFLTQGVDGVIEFQTDAAFGNVIMSRFRSADVPVIAIDIPMPGATFFGADNYFAGELAGIAGAEWAIENWDGQVDYILVLELPQSGPIPEARMQGQVAGIQETLENPVPEENIFYLDSKNTQEDSFEVTTDTLANIPEGSNVIAVNINDGTSLGVIAAFETAGREDEVIVVGQGADPSGQEEMIQEGSRYLGATGYFPETYGDILIPTMLDLLECRPVAPSVYQEHVFITADNVCEYYAEDWPEFCATEDED
ncbi:MAG: sugar ABC transporter substrate-binding protein [Aggregatilineales bacterium]